MRGNSYGRIEKTQVNDDVARNAEKIFAHDFTVITDLFSAGELAEWRVKIDSINARQKAEYTSQVPFAGRAWRKSHTARHLGQNRICSE